MATAGSLMVNLSARTDRLKKGLKESETMLSSFASKAGSILAGALSGFAIGKVVKDSVAAFAEAEGQTNKLRASLVRLGVDAASQMEDFNQFASAMQTMTTIEDDALKGALAAGANIAGKSGGELKTMGMAAIGLSKIMGTDLPTAMEAVAKATNGNFKAFKMFSNELDGAGTQQAKLDIIIRKGLSGIQLATAETDTLGGSWMQFKNILGDSLETIGGAIVRTFDLKNQLKLLGPTVISVGAALAETAVNIAAGFESMTNAISQALVGFVQSLGNALLKTTSFVAQIVAVLKTPKAIMLDMAASLSEDNPLAGAARAAMGVSGNVAFNPKLHEAFANARDLTMNDTGLTDSIGKIMSAEAGKSAGWNQYMDAVKASIGDKQTGWNDYFDKLRSNIAAFRDDALGAFGANPLSDISQLQTNAADKAEKEKRQRHTSAHIYGGELFGPNTSTLFSRGALSVGGEAVSIEREQLETLKKIAANTEADDGLAD